MNHPDYEIITLGREHNRGILDLLGKCPIDTGYMRLVFDRQPDFFRMPKARFDMFQYKGCMVNGELKGIFLMATHEGYVHGRKEKIFYLGNGFILPEMRGKGFIANAAIDFFLNLDPSIRYGYSLIMQKNKRAESYIGKTSPDYPMLPASRTIGQFVARNIPVLFPKKYNGPYQVRDATVEDLSYISRVLDEKNHRLCFGEICTLDRLKERLDIYPGFGIENFKIAMLHGKPAGVCSAWDPHQMRQTRVLAYGGRLLPLTWVFRALAAISGSSGLPAAGANIREMHLGDVAVHDDDPEIFLALLMHTYREAFRKGYHLLTFGSHAHDPMLTVARKFRGVDIHSSIVLVSTQKDLLNSSYPQPHINISFL